MLTYINIFLVLSGIFCYYQYRFHNHINNELDQIINTSKKFDPNNNQADIEGVADVIEKIIKNLLEEFEENKELTKLYTLLKEIKEQIMQLRVEDAGYKRSKAEFGEVTAYNNLVEIGKIEFQIVENCKKIKKARIPLQKYKPFFGFLTFIFVIILVYINRSIFY
jgi:hypothetical protein